MVKLEKLSTRPDFKKFLGKMGLQARGTGGVDSASTGGTWDISNADRIGTGEVELCNILIKGATQLVEWEHTLEEGGNVDAEIAALIGEAAPAEAAPAEAAPAEAAPAE